MARHSKEQQAKIRVLIREVCSLSGMTVDEYTDFLKSKFDVDSFANITTSEASDLITEMEIHKKFIIPVKK